MGVLSEYKTQLADLLRCSRWWDSDSVEEKMRMLSRFECPQKTIRLFRYYSLNEQTESFVLRNISEGLLTLTNPKRFNDPYDGMLYIDKEYVRRSLDQWSGERILACVEAVRAGKPFDGDNNPILNALMKRLAQVDVAGHKAYFCAQGDGIKKDGLENLMYVVPGWMRNRVRICCLSERGDSPPMWAHYGNCGKGFCVEYEVPTGFQSSWQGLPSRRPIYISLVPVLYSGERYDATHIVEENALRLSAAELDVVGELDTSHHDRLDYLKLIAFKSEDWSYENEWRLFGAVFGGNDPDYVDMIAPPVKSVTFGNNMDDASVEKLDAAIKSYVKKTGATVVLKRLATYHCDKAYNLGLMTMGTIDSDKGFRVAEQLATDMTFVG